MTPATHPGNEPASPDERGSGGGLSDAQRAASDARDLDRDRTLHAVHLLEAALGAAGPGRPDAWGHDVLGALTALDTATSEEEANAARPDSLLSDIARNHPRLRHRVHGLRSQFRHVRDTIDALRHELEAADVTDIADVRQRAAWLLAALRHQRARESDLIFEALYDTAGRPDDREP